MIVPTYVPMIYVAVWFLLSVLIQWAVTGLVKEDEQWWIAPLLRVIMTYWLFESIVRVVVDILAGE
jgi:hypothetical protein